MKKWYGVSALVAVLACGSQVQAQVMNTNFPDPTIIASGISGPFNTTIGWVIGALALLTVIGWIMVAVRRRGAR